MPSEEGMSVWQSDMHNCAQTSDSKTQNRPGLISRRLAIEVAMPVA